MYCLLSAPQSLTPQTATTYSFTFQIGTLYPLSNLMAGICLPDGSSLLTLIQLSPGICSSYSESLGSILLFNSVVLIQLSPGICSSYSESLGSILLFNSVELIQPRDLTFPTARPQGIYSLSIRRVDSIQGPDLPDSASPESIITFLQLC
jgi:hypothetical protein